MTSPPVARPTRHVEPANFIYPVACGGWPPCEACFCQRDLAWTTAPAIPGVVYICRDCARAAGRPVDLSAGEELAWLRRTLARLHHNHEITGDTLDAALTTPRPGRPMPEGRQMVRRLSDLPLRLQDAPDPAGGQR